MFISSEIPAAYNKVAEINDNYIILVRESKLLSETAYSAYIQFFNPSLYVVYTDSYYIKFGNAYNFTYTTNSSGELLNSSVEFESYPFILNETSSSEIDRPDYPIILFTQLYLLFCFVWLLNQLSKLIRKGGVFS